MKNRLIKIMLLCLLWAPSPAMAHGTGFRIIDSAPAIAAEFYYTDRSPMAYAQVLVFRPENSQIEYQNGRTDQAGRFTFYPETPGSWLVKVDDGMGHAVRAAFDVASPAVSSGAPVSPPAPAGGIPLKTGLGVSILLNIFLGLAALKKRGRSTG